VTSEDWKRVEAELNDLLPATETESHRPLKHDQSLRPADEHFILKHIAEALRLDPVGEA
jgi:hypothetical protein